MSKHFNDKDLVSVIATLKSKLYQESIKSKHFNELNERLKKENDELKKLYAETFVPNSTNMAEIELEEIYEALVGDNGMQRFTHAEIIDWAHQLVDKEEEI